jgi:hypothetical protein
MVSNRFVPNQIKHLRHLGCCMFDRAYIAQIKRVDQRTLAVDQLV